MPQHAKLMSPSGADRWMVCAGAPSMEDGRQDIGSVYADEGTAAHFLASESLISDVPPSSFIGRKIVVGRSNVAEFDGARWSDSEDFPADWRTRAEFVVDMDMAAAVNSYVQGVKRFTAEAEKVEIEVRVPLTSRTGEADAEGTSDCIAVVPYVEVGEIDVEIGTELQVHDLKYGAGHAVAAVGNKQLLIYAAAYAEANRVRYDRVRVVIHQPRKFDQPAEALYTPDEMAAFAADVKTRAEVVLTAWRHRGNWIGKDDSYLMPSEDGCRWCKAAADCPKLAKAVEEATGRAIAEFADLTTEEVKAEPMKWYGEDLGAKLRACAMLENWITAVRAEVETRLLAGNNAPELTTALGYKLVAGRKGAQAWSDETAVEEALKSMRLKQDEMYQFKLISPTQAEKLFGEKGSKPSKVRWNKLQAMIVQKDGAPHVAPLEDKRPPLVLDALAGMEDETGEDLV